MAEFQARPGQTQRPSSRTTITATNNPKLASTTSSFLRRLHVNAPNSTQLLDMFTLVISSGIWLLLTGLTLTAVVLGIIFFTPFVIISSPIWFPVGFFLFLMIAGFLTFCGIGVGAMAAMYWLYRYFRGLQPPGSDQFPYGRKRIFDTAPHVKDYAREYGGDLHIKVKNAALELETEEESW